MLKGQMLATALTSYYSAMTPNPLAPQGTINNLGLVKILLNPIKGTENVGPGFNRGSTAGFAEIVNQMLLDINPLWSTYSACGTSACKANTVLASDAFNFINNSQANIAP